MGPPQAVGPHSCNGFQRFRPTYPRGVVWLPHERQNNRVEAKRIFRTIQKRHDTSGRSQTCATAAIGLGGTDPEAGYRPARRGMGGDLLNLFLGVGRKTG